MTTALDAAVYCWNDLVPDRPMERLERRRIIGEQAMLSRVFLHKGCFVSTHAHENEQFACVLSGELRFVIGEGRPDERRIAVRAGEVMHLPSNVPHSAYAEEDSLVLDVFSPPSAKTGIDRS